MGTGVSVPLLWVDAFSERPYGGNAAAVCLLDAPAPAPAMQSLAFEMGLSETAFVWPVDDGFSLRWFTPLAEVDLCGHATLAAAHALATEGRLDGAPTLRFLTRSGELLATVGPDSVEIDLPAEEPAACEVPAFLAARWPALAAATGRFDLLVEVPDARAVRELAPDLPQIAALPYRGVIVTAPAAGADESGPDEPGADYVLRYFAPCVGVPEDPVTGSAQCVLGPYWAAALGRTRLRARQLSARGGVLDVTLAGARVRIGGRATTVLSGVLSDEIGATLRGADG